jgi:YebC/PmpR family DNA-binding regulatory protein
MNVPPSSPEFEVLPPADKGEAAKHDATARFIAYLMDNVLKVPGTKARVGINPFLDLIPVLGDSAAVVISALTIIEGFRRRVPKVVLTRMGVNVLLNGLLGTIPVVGEAFSFWYKPTSRNYQLLHRVAGSGRNRPWRLFRHRHLYHFPLVPRAFRLATTSNFMGRQWLQAKREVVNQKKGQVVGKLVKEIMVAAKLGGADPAGNARLFTAVEKARRQSVTRDVIERAIKKGAGVGDDKLVLEHVIFEGYAPHKVPVIVEVLTDNNNRTAPEIRVLFKRGQLGTAGSNKFLFDHVGLVEAYNADADADPEAAAIEAGAMSSSRSLTSRTMKSRPMRPARVF